MRQSVITCTAPRYRHSIAECVVARAADRNSRSVVTLEFWVGGAIDCEFGRRCGHKSSKPSL
jgi:hypothetical protein